MKKGVIILVLGVLVGATAYGWVYLSFTSSARALQRSEQPELAWLKEEFKLSDAEFKRISELHAAYLPRCHEMCRQIDAQNKQLETLLTTATNVTPEIERTLAETSRLRSECQTRMLRHFFEVSRTMPPEQGRRYLSWVKEKAFTPQFEMGDDHR